MKLVGLMLVRNEDWILGLSARVALSWVDSMVFLDHGSTDATAAILAALAAEYPGRVNVIREENEVWREMDHRQRTLDVGRDLGGTHFATIDADEILTANMLPTVRSYVETLGPAQLLRTNMCAMWRGTHQYRQDNSVWSNRSDLVLAFGDRPNIGWRAVNGYDHHQRAPLGTFPARMMPGGGVMHMQFADWRRLVAKHDYYRIIEHEKWPNKPVREINHMYSLATDERGLKCAKAPITWWAPYQQWMHHLKLNTEPWHEKYCRERIDANGPEFFAGLSLSALSVR